MKKLAIATAFSLASTSAFAGGFDDPVVETPIEIIEEDTASSAHGILVPVMFLLMVAAAVAN